MYYYIPESMREDQTIGEGICNKLFTAAGARQDA